MFKDIIKITICTLLALPHVYIFSKLEGDNVPLKVFLTLGILACVLGIIYVIIKRKTKKPFSLTIDNVKINFETTIDELLYTPLNLKKLYESNKISKYTTTTYLFKMDILSKIDLLFEEGRLVEVNIYPDTDNSAQDLSKIEELYNIYNQALKNTYGKNDDQTFKDLNHTIETVWEFNNAYLKSYIVEKSNGYQNLLEIKESTYQVVKKIF